MKVRKGGGEECDPIDRSPPGSPVPGILQARTLEWAAIPFLDEGYLLTTALPDLQCGIAPLGPPAPAQPRLLGRGVGPPGHRPWPRAPLLHGLPGLPLRRQAPPQISYQKSLGKPRQITPSLALPPCVLACSLAYALRQLAMVIGDRLDLVAEAETPIRWPPDAKN